MITRIGPNPEMRRWATFSDDGLYRYELGRDWGPINMAASGPIASTMVMVGINPSRASHLIDDQTVRKGVGFAKREGCTRFIIVNPFARIFTDQKDLVRAFEAGDDVEGPDNALFLYNPAFNYAHTIIVAHGSLPGSPRFRAQAAVRIELFRNTFANVPLWCLGRNNDGSPRHPLRLSYKTKLERW